MFSLTFKVTTLKYSVCCEWDIRKGDIRILIIEDNFIVSAGDVIDFPGNIPHFYKNSAGMISRAISIVTAVDIPKGKNV